MNTILFATSLGAPIAMLGMSTPPAVNRDCIFIIAVQDKTTFDSPQGQVILPDRPTEYACRFETSKDGTLVTFENQNGWRFRVTLDSDGKGTWAATKGTEGLSGLASAL